MATPKDFPIVDDYGLSGTYVYTTWLRIEVYSKLLFRLCHGYNVTGDNNVDLYRVNSHGKMERFAYFNSVSSVEEVDGPPEPDPVPSPAAVEAPETATKNDDYPF